MQRTIALHSGLAIVFAYFGICLAIYLIQVFPIPGVILMAMGGPAWIGFLVHIAMLHLGVAAISGFISRFWIAIPILFYAGGYALHLYSVELANDLRASIEQANAAAKVTIEQPFAFLSEGGGGAFELLEHYRVDRIFIRNGPDATGKYQITTQYFAKGEPCDRANTGWWYEKRFEPYLMRKDLFPTYGPSEKTRQCIISQDGLPAEWRYRIKSDYINTTSDFYTKRFGRKWTVIDERTGQNLLSVEVGGIKTLPPIPMIYAGCMLNSGAPSWDCNFGLMQGADFMAIGYKKRTDNGNPFIPTKDPDTWEISALARALSLELRRPTD